MSWPRQLPIDGQPADVAESVQAYARWLSTAAVPKLFINGEPGSALTGALREFCRTWPSQREVTVPGARFPQEDSPDAIGSAIADWLSGVPALQE